MQHFAVLRVAIRDAMVGFARWIAGAPELRLPREHALHPRLPNPGPSQPQGGRR